MYTGGIPVLDGVRLGGMQDGAMYPRTAIVPNRLALYVLARIGTMEKLPGLNSLYSRILIILQEWNTVMAGRFLLCCLLVVATPRAIAQRTLTLDACLQEARSKSLLLQLEDQSLRAVQLSGSENRTTGLPQVKLSGGASYAPVPGSFGYDPVISNGGQVEGIVALQQSLFDAGLRGLKADQNSVDIDRLAHEKRAVDRDLVFTVTAQFIEALRAQREVQLQAQSTQQLTDYLRLINQMLHGGTVSQTDLLKTKVQLDAAKRSLLKAAEEEALARITLAELMGSPDDTAFTVMGNLAEGADSTFVDGADTAIENIDLTMGRLSVQKSLLDVEISRRERWPQLVLSGDAGLLTSFENLREPPATRVSGLGYSVGISLEWPLFNWGAGDFRIEQRQAAADIEMLKLDLAARGLKTEKSRVSLQMRNAFSAIKSLHATIEAAENNYVLTKANFAGGGALSLEVLSAQQLLTDSRMSELQALASWQSLKARMVQLTTR